MSAPNGLDALPIRPELRGRTPYGAPQLDVAVRLNTNENSWPLPAGLAESIAAAVGAVAGGLNRYPTATPSRCEPTWPAISDTN